MAEETPAEAVSQEEVAPAGVAPAEQPSEENYVSKSDYQAGLEALEDRLADRLKDSARDRVKAEVSSEVSEKLSEFDKVVELLKPHLQENVDVQALKEREFLRNLMAETSSSPDLKPDSPPQEEAPAPASVPPGRETEIQTILEATGVSGEEPELLEYAEKNKGQPWYQVGQGFEDLAKSIAARSAGTPTGVVAPQGQVANPDLVKEYRTELDGLLYHRDGTGKITGDKRRNMNQLRQLQERYLELGLTAEDMEVGSTSKSVQFIHDWAPPV